MTSPTSINKFSNNNKPFSTHTGSLQTHPILPYSSVKQWNSTEWEHRSLATDVQLWYGQLSSVILNMSELFVLSVCIGFSNHVKNSKKNMEAKKYQQWCIPNTCACPIQKLYRLDCGFIRFLKIRLHVLLTLTT